MYLIELGITNRLLLDPQYRKEKLIEAQHMLSSPTTNPNNQRLVETWAIIGQCHGLNKEPILAEEAYLKVFEVIQTLDDEILLGKGYSDLGDTLFFCNDYGKAIIYYRQAIEIFERFNETDELLSVLSQIAYACERMEQSEEERYYLDLGIRQMTIHPIKKAAFLERIARSLGTSGEHKEAINVYEEALSIFEAEGFHRAWEDRVQNLIELYRKIGDEAGVERTLKRLESLTVDELLVRLDDNSEYVRLSSVVALVEQSKILKFDIYSILNRIIAMDPSKDVRELATIYLRGLDDHSPAESSSDTEDTSQ